MQRHRALAAVAVGLILLSTGPAIAGPPGAKRGAETETVEPGAMPRERARIMGYGPDDPRAAAEARRNPGGYNNAADEAKVAKEERRKAKAEKALKGR